MLRLFSSLFVLLMAVVCEADDQWSSWSDKTLCRLANDDAGQQYLEVALARGLTCVLKNNLVTQGQTESTGKEPVSNTYSERYFVDQPDVNDDFQIHFNYLVTLDGEDRQWDINGTLVTLLRNLNEAMYAATKANRFAKGEGKRYKYDLRSDGKLDISFVRMDKTRLQLDEYPNNDIAEYLFKIGMNNPKKLYFNFADFGHEDGGIAGVGVGNIFLRHHKMGRKGFMTINALHELQHTQGGAYACVPGTKNNHLVDRFDGTKHQLKGGLKLNHLVYMHNIVGCPQLADSVYLTPTSAESYDPYALNCLFELGRYTHKALTTPVQQLRDKGQYNWRLRFGSSCQWRDQNKDHAGYFMMGSNINILAP